MSKTARTGFLFRGTKEKSEGDVFHVYHLQQIPIWTGLRIAFLASYQCISGIFRVQFGNNSGTDMLEQYGILEQNRHNRQLFPPFPLPAYLSHSRGRRFGSLQVH
jgi:hypothetical protein